jgi:hypothetical protein
MKHPIRCPFCSTELHLAPATRVIDCHGCGRYLKYHGPLLPLKVGDVYPWLALIAVVLIIYATVFHH